MRGVTSTFDRSYQAAPESVARVRAEIAAFAAAHGVAPRRIDDIRLAVSEAVSNAVMHGYRKSAGTVHVSASHADGALWISIRDFGTGMHSREPGDAHTGMGLGLALIGRVVNEMSVSPQAGAGTEVQMRFALVSAAVPAGRRTRVS
jgi:stage II sporulation protein AB (anti-sigma F factor)